MKHTKTNFSNLNFYKSHEHIQNFRSFNNSNGQTKLPFFFPDEFSTSIAICQRLLSFSFGLISTKTTNFHYQKKTTVIVKIIKTDAIKSNQVNK